MEHPRSVWQTSAISVHPGYDGTLSPNTADLVAAVQAQPGYENLMFSVAMHPSNVNEMQFTYKAAGAVAFTPTASFGEVTAVAAQYELTPAWASLSARRDAPNGSCYCR